MGTWIFVAGVVCPVVSVIWLIMAYVAGLRARMSILVGTGLACIAGSVIGLLAVYIAMDHNPQGEFIDQVTGAVNYADLSVLFLSGFGIVSLAASLALAFTVWTVRGLRVLYRMLRA